MYVAAPRFAIRLAISPVIRLAAGAGACALLASCAANPFENAKVDPASPIAGEVARLANTPASYPSFASIPPIPKDVPAPRQFGRAAQSVTQARDQLEAATAPGTWSLNGTEDFAAAARAKAGAEAAPAKTGEADSFADTQRKRATPPPPPPK